MNGHSSVHSLEGLPGSWLAELVAKLPAHLKLQLRQCSKQLQQVVDVSGLQLRLGQQAVRAQAGALQLCREHLAAMDLSDIPCGSRAGSNAIAETSNAALVHVAARGLPCLQLLAFDAAHVQLLVTVAAHSPRLARIKLSSRTELSAADRTCWSKLQLQLPGLCSSLRCLELDAAAHQLFTQQSCMWPAVGACTGLQSLLLHMAKPHGYGIAHCSMSEQAWQAAVQPLIGLTRLEIGTRAPSSNITSFSHHNHSSPHVGSALTAAASSGADRQELQVLQHLRCYGFDDDAQDSWGLAWACRYSCLTSLDLLFASAGEVDFEAIAQLQQLHSLEIHCFPDELFTSSQLAPLASCSQLTCLRLDTLVIEPGHRLTAAVAAAAEDSKMLMLGSTAAANEGVSAAAVAGGLCSGEAIAEQLPQLSSLRKLVAGVLCKAPISSFVPQLTQLRDLDYDLAQLELSSSFINEQPPAGQEPLAQLTDLQLLAVNIHALVRHAASPSLTQLIRLRELHIDMVGNLMGTCISNDGGLPMLPSLTRLVMTIAARASHNLAKTYSTEEDALLWQNQATVQHMRLRGSRLLGGFLMHQHLLELLPKRLQQLRCIELVKCGDLATQDLAKLVDARAAPHIVVQRCACISERDCVDLQNRSGGAVVVEYSS